VIPSLLPLSKLTWFPLPANDSFISPGTACSLFEIVLKLFNRSSINCGKIVVLDEAHKVCDMCLGRECMVLTHYLQYLSEVGKGVTEGSKRLTERLLSFTRQQRHLAMRVVVSTYVIPVSSVLPHHFGLIISVL
jgi:hypothetical protein